MKKRVVSAFSLACAMALLLDYTASSATSLNNTDSNTKADTSLTAGAVSVAAVDLSSLDEISVTDSEADETSGTESRIFHADSRNTLPYVVQMPAVRAD